MKKCELCDSLARIYCESDQSSLCCDCDSKVHGANFIVAKHARALLCHVCQSFTPWSGSGPKLCLTVSICQKCATSCQRNGHQGYNNLDEGDEIDDNDDDDDDDDDDYEEDDDDYEEDGDGGGGGGCGDEEENNQVVPWSSTAPPPPHVSSSSTNEESSSS